MPDPLQNALVQRAMARDAGQTIGPLDPRTHQVAPQRDDPFSSPDLMHTSLKQLVDPSNWGEVPGMAAGIGAIGIPDVAGKSAAGDEELAAALMNHINARKPDPTAASLPDEWAQWVQRLPAHAKSGADSAWKAMEHLLTDQKLEKQANAHPIANPWGDIDGFTGF